MSGPGGSFAPRPEVVACFSSPDLFKADSALSKGYVDGSAKSGPYKHSVVRPLLDDALLRAAREEIVSNLSFTEKETDIYKVNQTGDLANLDGLPADEQQQLQSVFKVRNALFSKEFRSFIQRVTGCGPLSEKKKDMSINDYRDGCHLLNHDDVISTRRVSFILYLPDREWKPEYGGALELYPVSAAHEPEAVPTTVHPPLWNQFAFFPVIPGYSFHSVEEVVHPNVSRLSISGWFHRPLPDEEGFSAEIEAQEEQARKEYSSAESLVSQKRTRPFVPYPDAALAKEQEDAGADEAEMTSALVPGEPLSPTDRKFLTYFLNQAYLNPKVQSKLFDQFGDESNLLLAEFLRPELAKILSKGLVEKDRRDGFRWFDNKPEGVSKTGQELRDACTIQPHLTGSGKADGTSDEWTIEGPPHHHRFLSLVNKAEQDSTKVPETLAGENPPLPSQLPETAEEVIALVRGKLFPSPAFRAFLANVTQLIPLAARYPLWARRFRPGLDYTLAKKDEDEAVLQVNLGLTPNVADSLVGGGPSKKKQGLAAKKAKAATPSGSLSTKQIKELRTKWEEGVVGGWECFMAPTEEGDDPAVYGSGSKKPAESDASPATAGGDDEDDDEAEDVDEDEDEDFDGVLLSLTPQFNSLNIVLRDEGVMHFVQYLSASAGGSRWDVEGEWRVGSIEDSEDEEGDEN